MSPGASGEWLGCNDFRPLEGYRRTCQPRGDGDNRRSRGPALPPAPRRRPVTIRLLVVDEHVLIRLGLARAVADCPDITLVGSVGSAAEALAQVDRYRPTVATVGLMLPHGDGITAAQRLRERVPDLGTVLLSAVDDDAVLFRALDAGLSAYLTKA